MLLGLLSGVVDGNTYPAGVAYSAAMFYSIVYVLMSLGAFGMLLYLSRSGFECETLEDMKGLNRRSPWFAFIMLGLMFSLAGIPPTAGFYAKLTVLSAAIDAGQVWLAVVAVLLPIVLTIVRGLELPLTGASVATPQGASAPPTFALWPRVISRNKTYVADSLIY